MALARARPADPLRPMWKFSSQRQRQRLRPRSACSVDRCGRRRCSLPAYGPPPCCWRLLAANIIFGRLPAWTLALYLIAGAGSFWFYRDDKQAANARRSRTPERKLHILDLTFGIIGGLLAQHVFRHKTYKSGYVLVTGLITALHILVLGLILLGVLAPNTFGQGLQHLVR